MSRRVHPLPRQETTEAGALQLDHQHVSLYERQREDADRQLAHGSDGATDIAIPATTSLEIFHGLERVPQGWRLARLTAAGAVTFVVRETARSKTTLTLRNDNAIAITIRLEVF